MQNLIYFLAVFILSSGLFTMLTSDNLVRKIIGLGVFQSSVLIFYIALGKVKNGIVPIDICAHTTTCPHIFSSPLPHVLMLTAIVVGFSTLCVGLALIYQIHKEYGSVLESKIEQSEDELS
ncbi:MAG: cation:proton antiporter subunit C [Rickettsiaceae bacterium]|nr:cation:proton antiporter subunit C [Rickettsiaceae bacterium]